jgi:hypothetical protein
MTAMERRLAQLEAQFEAMTNGPTFVQGLMRAKELILQRVRLGLPRPPRQIPAGDDPLSQRLRNALLKAEKVDPS